jgi:hypothetical protein
VAITVGGGHHWGWRCYGGVMGVLWGHHWGSGIMGLSLGWRYYGGGGVMGHHTGGGGIIGLSLGWRCYRAITGGGAWDGV